VKHGILDSVMGVWIESGYPRPDDTGWRVSSEVPIGQGLKSSAALACAAAMALDEASWTALSAIAAAQARAALDFRPCPMGTSLLTLHPVSSGRG
jgi:shikimate kinase